MKGRSLHLFISLGGFCALLGYFAILSNSKGALHTFLGTYLILLVSFLVTLHRNTSFGVSGKPYKTRRKV